MPGSKSEEEALIGDAEIRRDGLNGDIQSIQTQLGDKQRIGDDGKRLNSKEYWAWKKSVQILLNQKLKELRELKQYTRELHLSTAPKHEAVSHVANLHGILLELSEDGVDMDDGEQLKIDAAGQYLRRAK